VPWSLNAAGAARSSFKISLTAETQRAQRNISLMNSKPPRIDFDDDSIKVINADGSSESIKWSELTNETVIEAMSSTENTSFLVWDKNTLW
jgi:hypothetical protein